VIVSGGQTGADQGALMAALALGIVTGGWAPRGWRTELGPAPWLFKRYNLREHPSSQYAPRTVANATLADMVAVFGETTSPGTRLTLRIFDKLQKSILINPSVAELRDAIDHPLALMVAGNRESLNRGIETFVFNRLVETWEETPGAIPRKTPIVGGNMQPGLLPRLTGRSA
jgi:hypothetical protein